MKTLWIFAAVLLVVQLEECYGRFHRRDREFRDEKKSFRRPHLSSAEKFADSTPEHVIKVERESDGMLVGGFEGFGDDEKDIGSSRSFLNAEDNGRQGRGRSSRRRANYNNNDEYDSDRGNSKKNSRDYSYSEKSNRNNYNSRESRNHRSNNRNSGYGDNFDKNDNYGFDEKEDSFGVRKGNSNYDNGGYSNNDDTYYDNDDNQAYGSRGNKNSGHNSRGSRGNGNYGGSSHGRQGNYNRGRSQGNYNSPRRGLDGMSDVEAAQALYTGNPNAGNSKLDGLVNNKPVYLGEYNEKSDKQGKPRTEMGDYLYGENMVF